MKLTEEQIKFIDDRLELMGAEFLDIRYEMVDHIASAMEEMDGDFKQNFMEFYILNRNNLINQYKRATRWRMLRGLNYFWRVLREPLPMFIFLSVFFTVYLVALKVDDIHGLSDYSHMGIFSLMPLFIWTALKSKRISTLRSLVQLYSLLYSVYLFAKLFGDEIIDKGDRIVVHRFCIAGYMAVGIVLLIAILRCRKQYVGKYI